MVFPDADLKFFLEARPDVRARRRYEELFQKGSESTLDAVLTDQTKRDRDDASRVVAPLKPAADAVRVDSSALPLSQVVQQLERTIRAAMTSRRGQGARQLERAHRSRPAGRPRPGGVHRGGARRHRRRGSATRGAR